MTYDADSKELSLYVNGELSESGTVESSTFSLINVGHRAATLSAQYHGGVDDLSVFYRALSSNELKSVFNRKTITEGLVPGWQFDEAYGSKAMDSSGNDNHGRLVGLAGTQVDKWTEGYSGGAIGFSDNTHVEVEGFESITDTTWATWINLKSKPHYGAAISADFDGAVAGHSLGFQANETAFHPRVLWNHSKDPVSLLSPDPIDIEEWNHIAVTYNSATLELALYVNGEKKDSKSASTTPFTSVNLARRAASSSFYLDAVLDDIRIYNRSLQGQEISDLMQHDPDQETQNQNSEEEISSGVVAYYSFDEGENGILKDYSGNSFDGKLVNFEGSQTLTGRILDQAYKFDGESNFVIVPSIDKLSDTRNLTVSVWLSPDAHSIDQNGQTILHKDSDLSIVLEDHFTGRIQTANQ